MQQFSRSDCHARLGIEVRLLPLAGEGDELVNATRGFKKLRARYGSVLNMRPIQLTDVVRSWLMLTWGGYYFDADAFVLSPGLTTWRRCAAVLGRNDFDLLDHVTPRAGEPPTPSDEELPPTNASYINTAMMLSAAGSRFATAYWRYLESVWDGRHSVEDVCCGWPSQFARRSPLELQVSGTMRLFPFCAQPERSTRNHTGRLCTSPPHRPQLALQAPMWIEQLRYIAARAPTHAVHLANWGVRTEQWGAVLHEVLNRSVRLASPPLSTREAPCVDTAHRWLKAVLDEYQRGHR